MEQAQYNDDETTEETDGVDEEISGTFTSVTVRDASLLPVVISEDHLQHVDKKVISEKFYNSFNFSKLPIKKGQEKLVIGITSPNKGEGKTLAASNLAVSLATAYHQRTVIVDMNFSHPNLHTIFGGDQAPGIADAMCNRKLNIVPTKIENLYLLSAGNLEDYSPGIKDTIVLREILYTLEAEFDCIIIDMGAVFPIDKFPVHFINEIDGLLTVIDNSKTQKYDIKNMYKHLDERRIVGHIFNRFES